MIATIEPQIIRPRPRRLLRPRQRTIIEAAPAFVQFAENEGIGGPPQFLSFSSNTTAGNAIVVVGANQGSIITFTTVSDNIGSTYVPCAGATVSDPTVGGGTVLSMFVAFKIAGGSTQVELQWTGGQSSAAFYIFEISGVNAYDSGSGHTGNQPPDPTCTSGSFTTRFPSEIVIAANIITSSSISQGPGYTLIDNTPGFGDILEYAVVGAETQAATAVVNDGGYGMVAGAFYKAGPNDVIFFGTDA
jgi:hypothetical protein